MHRFFVKKDDIKKNTVMITGDEKKHLTKVLRLTKGDEIIVCDDTGKEYVCQISEIDNKQKVRANIIDKKAKGNESHVKISLFQSIPKSDKMEGIIKRAVELGAYDFYPVFTDRTIVKLDEKKIKKRIERWQRISKEASKQCKRAIIPKVNYPLDFEKAIKIFEQKDISLLFYEDADDYSLKKVKLKGKNSIGIFIGPEGGFSSEEICSIKDRDISILTLGKRILRTETASTAVLSIIMHEIGQLS